MSALWWRHELPHEIPQLLQADRLSSDCLCLSNYKPQSRWMNEMNWVIGDHMARLVNRSIDKWPANREWLSPRHSLGIQDRRRRRSMRWLIHKARLSSDKVPFHDWSSRSENCYLSSGSFLPPSPHRPRTKDTFGENTSVRVFAEKRIKSALFV